MSGEFASEGSCTTRCISSLKIHLNPGFTYANLAFYFYSTFASVAALVFLNASLPYLLTYFLKVPKDEQSNLIGNILVCNEVTIILTVFAWGLLSDHSAVGRRPVYCLGFVLMGLSIFAHPIVGVASFNNVAVLMAVRVLFALGAGASVSMMTAVLADYPAPQSRGKSGGFVGLAAGLGALFSLFVLLRIPDWVGLGAVDNGQIMYWAVGAFFIISGIVIFHGLSERSSEDNKHAPVLVILKDGFLAARDPRILVSYLASFAARGDAILITTILSLWITQYEESKHVSPEKALARAGVISGVAQTLAIIFAPAFGYLSDVMDKTLCQAIAAFIAAVGYIWTFFISDPGSSYIYLPICMVGIGEIGMIVASQILVATAANNKENAKGTVSGFFSLCGSLGILVTSKISGVLYQSWKPTAPFLLVGLFNCVVFAVALGVYVYYRMNPPVEYNPSKDRPSLSELPAEDEDASLIDSKDSSWK